MAFLFIMKFIRILLVFVLVLTLGVDASWARQKQKAKAKKQPWITAKSFVVMDIDNGKVLYCRKPYLRLPAASTVKVMTAILALETLSPEKHVVISARAAGVEPSKAYLTQGASYSALSLIKALLISSSNDAAIALAEAVAGSEDNFARLMNKKARQLKMRNTHFVTASGLPDKRRKQYTTAYDLAILMRYALKYKIINTIMSTRSAAIVGSDGRRLYLTNHNKLMRSDPYFVVGKTGFTMKARHCFLGTDHGEKKDIVFSLLASYNPWQDIRRLASYGLRLESGSCSRKAPIAIKNPANNKIKRK